MPGWIRSIHPNEEMILKDTKNTIEDTVEKIKENVRENKLSCILMIGFVLLFCVLSGPEIAQEAASRHVQSDEVKNPQSESVQPETESEIAQTEETAKDCGKLLEDIYRRTWVSRGISNEIEDMLLAQQTRYKIPAGLPEGVLCGNKTGEMDATENDAAIIYAKDCDYILVVLSNGWSSKDQAITRIQSVSSLVYDYLNGDENGQEE